MCRRSFLALYLCGISLFCDSGEGSYATAPLPRPGAAPVFLHAGSNAGWQLARRGGQAHQHSTLVAFMLLVDVGVAVFSLVRASLWLWLFVCVLSFVGAYGGQEALRRCLRPAGNVQFLPPSGDN